MILILTSSADTNADYVIAWLKQYNYPYFRLNADAILDGRFYISPLENKLYLDGQEIDLSKVNAVWLYKFGGFHKTGYFHKNKAHITQDSVGQLSSEFSAILISVMSMLSDKKWLTRPSTSQVNKIDILRKVAAFDIDVPPAYIVSEKQILYDLLQKEGSLISKSIYEPFFIKKPNGYYSMFTRQLDKENIDKLPSTFFPSLVQRKIDKKYEIRCFYLDGEFYSMAIFSQKNKSTKLDFRRYDWANPNRKVPYQLPKELASKLRKMLENLNMNCCSLDILKSSEDNKYYFLEINPTGQFGMVSQPCNYDLYNKIAQKLIQMDS